eukprot:GHVL01036989.1.p1 GENE.GHVL01036989.1~~GHVL01036989.1.p1  ORF type:complete len:623 (-),score=138.24 GHVL01036989.1:813-2636(-)
MEQQSILDINDIYSRIDELYLASQELSERGLVVGAQRTIELADSFGVDTNNIKKNNTKKNNIKKNNIKLQRAQTYMMSREYARGAYVLQNIENIEEDFLCSFVWLYCIYMDGERRKEQDLMDTVDDEAKELATNPHLKQVEGWLMHIEETVGTLDGHLEYLYGRVLWGLGHSFTARNRYISSLSKYPLNFTVWQDLLQLCSHLDDPPLEPVQVAPTNISDPTKIVAPTDISAPTDIYDVSNDLWLDLKVKLPNHWIREFFHAALLLESQQGSEAAEIYAKLADEFPESSYLIGQLAVSFYIERDFNQAADIFNEVRKIDPYQISHMDTYSNILFVLDQRSELSILSRELQELNRYCPESCFVIGNYYALLGLHERAVLYFRRSIVLNAYYAPAWVLLGHEFLELKNPESSIGAYRRALSLEPRDYRGWYGLGQAYELLGNRPWALLYYTKACTIRPRDMRFWMALASSYEAAGNWVMVAKCSAKAESCGESDGTALRQLASAHQKLGSHREASLAYKRLTELLDKNSQPTIESAMDGVIEDGSDDGGDETGNITGWKKVALGEAYQYLAKYHNQRDEEELCNRYCRRLMELGPENRAIARELMTDNL